VCDVLGDDASDLLKGTAGFVSDRVGVDSIWSVLHREGRRLFPDELVADLFTVTGRRSVPPQVPPTRPASLTVSSIIASRPSRSDSVAVNYSPALATRFGSSKDTSKAVDGVRYPCH